MSTEYVTREPMTLEQFYEQAAELGWHHAVVDGRDVVRMAEDSPLVAFDVREAVCSDGQTRVEFTRYGGNDVSELAMQFACHHEYSDAFQELIFFDMDDDDEAPEVTLESLPQTWVADFLEQEGIRPGSSYDTPEIAEWLDIMRYNYRINEAGEYEYPVRRFDLLEVELFKNGEVFDGELVATKKANWFYLSDEPEYLLDMYADHTMTDGWAGCGDAWNWVQANCKGDWYAVPECVPYSDTCESLVRVYFVEDADALRFKVGCNVRNH